MTRGLYRGRRIEDLSREELMEALVEMGELYQKAIKDHRHSVGVLA